MVRLIDKDIQKHLTTSILGQEISCLDSVDSTNSEAKRRALEVKDGTIILSEEQTAGRGRQGRSWLSPRGKGIWMSIILKPDLTAEKVPQITQIAAAALCLVLEKKGILGVEVKWPNDILIDGKKLSGILTEMQSKGDSVDHVILGIGLNTNMTNQDFPEELQNQATSLYMETGISWERPALIADIINSFEPLYKQYVEYGDLSQTLDICRKKSAVIGTSVILHNKGKDQEAEVLDLGPNGELYVRLVNGEILNIVSGEIYRQG